jgi:putative SOS response-associated peptidase YedK
MGYRVSRQEYIRLKQIEKQFGLAASMEELRSGFVYGKWGTLVANEDKTDVEVRQMDWEFRPNWIKDMDAMKVQRKKGIPFLNAKSENLFLNDKGMKAMWADAARNTRCLVLATHFFEWRHYKPEGAKKDITYPYVIDFYNEDEPMYMAGIYNIWTDKSTGETVDTFALVTTAANEIMAEIHNTKKRQPTILNEDLAYEWIMGNLSDERISEIAKYQLPSEMMNVHTIAKDFQTSDTPLAEFNYDELPVLGVAI